MAIDQMMSDVAPARSWKMSFISDTEEKDHALAMKSLNQGVRLMKTELNSLTAYQLMLKLPNEKSVVVSMFTIFPAKCSLAVAMFRTTLHIAMRMDLSSLLTRLRLISLLWTLKIKLI